MSLRYLTAKLAQQIDEELMNAAGAFSIDQLMELAGLACAQTLATVYSRRRNQGGDGLVAARHLATIWMPKSQSPPKRLKTQCDNMHIQTIAPSSDVQPLRDALARSDVILDAIFGFSFQPPVRAPFDAALPLISQSGLPIVSVDIPSGWDVEKGNAVGVGLNPDGFKGRHFLGGRFVPKAMEEKFQLNLPAYPGFDQIVELPSAESSQKL
ncbi:YjeF N-terminal domain-containing protein [Fomitopsis serialis]|uniref:YjeF N-terminal domain-containing protein n=1 Tax=Fomitopsis serialis TaxID=139415 RepID=UPI00200767D3|nr:YjeF N-terminal domain-containing protein [Neoantrodia serialis]KAH9936349.1 YjeF N-terminal domain-containing protein [Neoantrodia serialis]